MASSQPEEAPGTLRADAAIGVPESALTPDGERLMLVGVPPTVIRQFATHLTSDQDAFREADVRILCSKLDLDAATGDNITAAQLSRGVEDDMLGIAFIGEEHELHDELIPLPPLMLTEDRAAAFAGPGVIEERDSDLVGELWDTYESAFALADEYKSELRTPTLEEIEEKAREYVGPEYADELMAAFDAVDTLGTDEDPIRARDLAVIVGARQQETNYDVSRAMELAGLVSKATISRAKTHLEDEDVIETDKVPTEVGRPRLRYIPKAEWLTTEAVEDVIEPLRAHLR